MHYISGTLRLIWSVDNVHCYTSRTKNHLHHTVNERVEINSCDNKSHSSKSAYLHLQCSERWGRHSAMSFVKTTPSMLYRIEVRWHRWGQFIRRQAHIFPKFTNNVDFVWPRIIFHKKEDQTCSTRKNFTWVSRTASLQLYVVALPAAMIYSGVRLPNMKSHQTRASQPKGAEAPGDRIEEGLSTPMSTNWKSSLLKQLSARLW